MKIPKMTLIILFLILKVITTEDEFCASNYQSKLLSKCQSLTDSVTGKHCHLFNNRCQRWYEECSEYDPEDNFNDDLCKAISPSDSYKKCLPSIENGEKKCVEFDKECQDITDARLCSDYNIGSEERCVYLYDEKKCEKHFNKCDGLEQSQCANNIPVDEKKCEYDQANSKCISKDRICSEFIKYRDSFSYDNYCINLKGSDGKVCFLNNGKCSEAYKTCSGAKDKNTCEKTNKLKVANNYEYIIDEKYKCFWDEDTEACQEKEIYCEDYKTYGRIPSSTFCNSLNTKNPIEGHEIWCSYNSSSGECVLRYRDCEDYNFGITNPDERDENVCNSITVGYNDKCILKDQTCQKVHKKCEDFEKQSYTEHYCHISEHEDPEMKCAFGDGKCRDMFLNCEAYNNKIEIEDRKKEDCESIIPTYENDANLYACVFSESNTCDKKKIENCEDFGGQNETHCESLSSIIKDSSKQECTLKYGKCTTQFRNCNDARIQNRTACESIKPSDNNFKCEYMYEYYCNQRYKTCSDFTGDSVRCLQLNSVYSSNGNFPLDISKKCVYENGKCYETTKSLSDYTYCSNYRGIDKNFCESIQPRNTNFYRSYVDYTSKCVYGDFGCERVTKNCSEAKNYKECSSFKASNENKKCVFLNNVCVEQYKTCQLYEESEETLDKNICESIILDDFSIKCIFTPETGSKGKCRSEAKSCEDFNIETLKSECDAIDTSSYDYSKKCTYSNNACSLSEKSCFELSTNGYPYSLMNEEMCEAASTGSSEIKCHYQSFYGCYIGVKDNAIDNSNEGNQQCNNSGAKYLNEIMLYLLLILF